MWECVKREFLYHRGFKVDLLSVLNPLPGVDRPVFIYIYMIYIIYIHVVYIYIYLFMNVESE